MTKIYLNGNAYDIRNVNASEIGSVNTWGVFSEFDKHILMNSDVNKRVYNETLIHEILHCIDVNYNGCRLTIEGDEGTINSFAAGLYNFFVSNKENLIDFIKKI